MYGPVYRNVFLPAYERLRGRTMLRHLRELEKTQWLPADEVKRRQWEALKRILEHAYAETPFYREHLDAAGVRPEDIREPEDLARVPCLEKRHLQERQDDLIARSYRDRPLITSHSGGSTGQPVAFKFHREHYDRRVAAWARADRWAGWELGERQVVLWLGVGSGVGRRRFRDVLKERLHWRIMRWTVITCTNLSAETVPEYHRIMCRVRPRSMYALAQSAYAFALMLEALRLKPPPMRGIILGAEKVFPYQKAKIQEVFGTPVFERYGCQEFCNIAEECDRHNGMHVNADGLYVEVVDPQGRPLPPGEVGEVVVTSLDNFAMPFIRYRLGDMGSLMDGPCACGRGLPRIKEIVGRTLDMIVTPEGRVCSGVMIPHFMKEFESVREFQFVQESLDALTLRIVPGAGYRPSTRAFLEQALRRWVGPRMKITIEERDALEKTASGKYRMVVSRVKIEDAARDVVKAPLP